MQSHSEFDRLGRAFGWHLPPDAVFREGTWYLGTSSAVSYPGQGRDLLARAEEYSPWFAHRNRIILRLLRQTGGLPPALWEIGSGNGFVTLALQEAGLSAVAVEPSPEGAALAARRGVRSSVSAFLQDLHLPDQSIPAAGCFDVLEHLEDPIPLLGELYRLLEPGGRLAITVPALPDLWSETDEASGHFRRYRRAELDALLAQAGFRSVRRGYAMACLVPSLWLLRTLPYRRGRRMLMARGGCLASVAAEVAPTNPLVNMMFAWVLRMEYLLTTLISPPFGTSVAGVYAKPIA